MDAVTIILIAVGLALDAFSVSLTRGLTMKNQRITEAFMLGISFSSFQVMMPAIGWIVGLNLRHVITGLDHWIAFGLLCLIGWKMIYESFTGKSKNNQRPLNLTILLVLSIATSIDALAVGVTFALLTSAIILPLIVIGAITFILSFIGVYLGNHLGRLLENKIEVMGGLILIGIGVKILIEHLFYSV